MKPHELPDEILALLTTHPDGSVSGGVPIPDWHEPLVQILLDRVIKQRRGTGGGGAGGGGGNGADRGPGGGGHSSPGSGSDVVDNVQLWEALHHVDPDLEYDDWLKVIQGLHATGASWAYEMAERWSTGEIWRKDPATGASEGSLKYKPGCVTDRWGGFSADGGVTVGSVFMRAREGGWKGSTVGAQHMFGEVARSNVNLPVGQPGPSAPLFQRMAEIPIETFPDIIPGIGKGPPKLKATVDNMQYLLEGYGVDVRYNAISRQMTAQAPWFQFLGKGDAEADLLLEHVRTQSARCMLPTGSVGPMVHLTAHKKQFNPVTEYLMGLKWDGHNHIQDLVDGVVVPAEHVRARDIAVPLWLVQACAAGDMLEHCLNDEALPKYEYVLVFQAFQGIKKTTWLNWLVPDRLREYFKAGVMLDPGDKDSIIKATDAWIVELGEIESTFDRKSLGQLKAFLSDSTDNFRPPYARAPSKWQRHTVFAGTVNNSLFLADATGNRRYWCLSVEALAMGGVDVEQVWAQAWHMYANERLQWWPTDEQEDVLDEARHGFEESHEHPIITAVLERFRDFSPEWKGLVGTTTMKTGEIYRSTFPFERHTPKQQDLRVLTSWLDMNNLDSRGQPDRVAGKGSRNWHVPIPKDHKP